MQLTEKEIQNALVFLNRTNLNGGESEAMVELKYKLGAIHQELLKASEDPPKTVSVPPKAVEK